MKRTTKAMSSREIMAQVMTKICDMDKAQIGKVYDFIVDTFENGAYEQAPTVQEPVAEYKAPAKSDTKKAPAKKKAPENTVERYVIINGVKLRQASQKDGFNRDLYEAHARALGVFTEGEGTRGTGKVKDKKDKDAVYRSMWYDYKPYKKYRNK